ncbi:hypothetical protein GCM10011341_07700 [Frigidibacter albus]|nr:glycosyltransferase family 8 protein [Frigidibacter albus]GGH46903.1 hypothetical protein GCM10011341_07700 [Frigidibacter albus]
MLVVTCSDDRYALGVGALFASILRFNPAARLALVDLGISTRNLAALQVIAAEAGSRIEVLALSPEGFGHLRTKGHITHAAYARLFIPDLFPLESRCLYLDCDMVATGPIDDLWQMDLAGLPLGAVVARRPDPAELAFHGIAENAYVNTGLLLMDLEVWRRDGLAARCLGFAAAKGGQMVYHDQSAINGVLAGAIRFLPETFNTSEDPRRLIWRIPRIIHYKSPRKPWNAAVPLGSIWWHFIDPHLDRFEQDAVAQAQAAAKLPPARRRRSLPQNLRRLMLGWMVERPCLARLAASGPMPGRAGGGPTSAG